MSDSSNDSAAIRNFIIAGSLLTLGTLIILSIALFMGTFDTSTRDARAQFEREQLEARLERVGAVRVDEDAVEVALEAEDDADVAAAAIEDSDELDDADVASDDDDDDVQRAGADVYASVCMACHAAGVMNALKLNDEDGWADLKNERDGLDELVSNAINGIGGMPARGGDSSLSDGEVRAAVVYMLEEAGLEVED